MKNSGLVDTHCHLDFPEFDQDRLEVINRAKENGIDCIINVGSDLDSSKRGIELTKKYDFVYATAGVHPHDSDQSDAKVYESVKALAIKDKVVAIGEIGLDYYKNFSKPENQRPLFASLLNLAKELNLPIVIHTRQAEADTLEIINKSMPVRAVVHCFSGDEAFLKECLDLGFYISFTCNITYKKAQNLRDMVKLTPFDRLMLETDAPYLSPEGFRGKRNEPMQVRLLAQEVAKIKQVSFGEIANITTKNALEFFGISL